VDGKSTAFRLTVGSQGAWSVIRRSAVAHRRLAPAGSVACRRRGLFDVTIDVPVAELGHVVVGVGGRPEGGAGEKQAEELGGRWIVGGPAASADLHLVSGVLAEGVEAVPGGDLQ
jgi:hypothetical protein